MQDDPKKKKPAAAPAQAPAPDVSQMSPDEYNAAFQEDLKNNPPSETPAGPTPVEGFWHRTLNSLGTFIGLNGEEASQKQDKEILSAIPRGLANAGQNIVNTGVDAANALADRGTSLLKKAGYTAGTERLTHPQLVSEDETLAAYGNRSDDPIAAFTESSAQFVAGLALARGLGVTGIYAQAAIADAAAFDPYEAQLAELVARAPSWTGLDKLGELLSVKGDDGAIVARLKRSAAGVISGGILDGLIAGARWMRGSRVLASKTATAAEKTAAQATVTQSEQVIQNVADATHTAEGDHVVVRPTEDGHYTLELNEAGFFGKKPPEAVVVPTGSSIMGEGSTTAVVKQAQEAVGPEAFQKAVEEEIAARGGRQAENAAVEMAATEETARKIVEADRVKFKERGEAETTAAGMNAAINERITATEGMTPEQLATHRQFATELFSAQTAEEVAARAETANFNLSYYASQPEVMAQIEAVSKQFREAMDAAQRRPEGVSVEESIRIAREAIGGMTEREAPAVIRAKLKTTEDLHAWLLASDMVMRNAGQKLAKMSALLEARPFDKVLHEEARQALQQFYDLTRDVAGANSEVGRSLRILQERADAAERGVKFAAEGSAAEGSATASAKEAATESPKNVKTSPKITAGMTHREIAAQVRMIRMANGLPRNMFAVAHAAQTIQKVGLLPKVFEVFANALLSGPSTVQTVLVSGAGVNMFEPLVHMAAGVGTLNRELLQQGADIMWGNFKYLGDNLRATAASLRAGRSIINPQPQHIAIGGVTGEIVRAPGRVLTAADEFSRVTAYRARVRAASLRIGRQQGLTGAALETRVAEDLRESFDPATGIATLPDALKYAEVPTFSGPLGRDTFGGGLQNFVNNHLEARFIAPFVKASTNIFRYVHKSIPVLNLLNREVRETLARGGEEAAVIHARSALAGTVYGFGFYQALAGNITGRGPSDPDLRKLWLKNHQPYSIRVGGQWYSYARLDPLATPLGLIADGTTIVHEMGEKAAEASDVAYATVAALFYNMSSKSYMQGITQFADAWASNDPHATARWLQNFGGNIGVPNLVAGANPDNVYRDVQSMADAVISRIPGWSTTLDPRFDIFGEPTMKAPGLLNRNQMFTAKPAGRSVEDNLMELGKGFSPAPSKMFGGLIDLKDRNAFNNGTSKSPWVRFNELLRSPENGAPSMRDAMTDLVRSPDWNDMSDGTSLFPGGRRWLKAAGVKERYEARALKQVREEYPKLDAQIRAVTRMRGAAIRGGEEGVSEVESLFGTSPTAGR